jgi:CDGSH-type Zn-finger protein
MSVTIKVLQNGPLVVQGEFNLIDAAGNPIEVKKASLCRCGGSTNKPFCDGTHSRIGFQGAAAAVQEAEGEKA